MASALATRWVVVACVACGRVGFSPAPAGDARRAGDADGLAGDATVGDAPATTGLISTGSMIGSGRTLDLAIPAVPTGDLLVVAITTWDGTAVAAVTAGAGEPLTSAGARAEQASTSSELWYASPSPATAAISVTMASSSTGFDVWAADFHGFADGPPATTAEGCLAYPPAVEVASAAAPTAGALVFGTTMLAYPVFVDAVAAPFTTVGPLLSGNGAAYTIATTPGSYGPSWQVGSGAGSEAMTCSSTAVFLPAP